MSKPKGARRLNIPKEIWADVRKLYETENYSQRDLVAYMAARGWKVAQSKIAQVAIDERWVKGAILEQLRADVHTEIAERFGDDVRRFLSTAAGQARLLAREAIAILAKANEARKIDPMHTMNPITLRTLSSVLKETQEMEARAIGFDIDRGRPMAWSPDEANKVEKEPEGQIVVRQFSEDELVDLRKRSRVNHGEATGNLVDEDEGGD
jgi:hypothetical protein